MGSSKRMFGVSFLVLALAVLFFVTHRHCRTQPHIEVPAVVANRDLPAETIIDSDSIKIAGARTDAIRRNCLHNKSMVVGRKTILPIPMGDCVLPSEVAVENGDSYAALYSPSLRAVSISLKGMREVGFVQRGARVDVVILGGTRGGNKRTTVLKNIVVLAVGQEIERDSPGDNRFVPVATLLVSADQAGKLASASRRGRISLSLSTRDEL